MKRFLPASAWIEAVVTGESCPNRPAARTHGRSARPASVKGVEGSRDSLRRQGRRRHVSCSARQGVRVLQQQTRRMTPASDGYTGMAVSVSRGAAADGSRGLGAFTAARSPAPRQITIPSSGTYERLSTGSSSATITRPRCVVPAGDNASRRRVRVGTGPGQGPRSQRPGPKAQENAGRMGAAKPQRPKSSRALGLWALACSGRN